MNVAARGAGMVLRQAEITEPAIRTAIETMVRSSDMRRAAQAVAAEIAAMPSEDEVAAALVDWATAG